MEARPWQQGEALAALPACTVVAFFSSLCDHPQCYI